MTRSLIILVGNIGSGKSTVSLSLARQGYRVINMDSVRTMLGGGDYIFDWDLEKKLVYKTANFIYFELLREGSNIVADNTNMSKERRIEMIREAKEFDYNVTVLVLPDLGREVHVDRRMKSEGRGYTPERWGEVYDRMEKAYQTPTMDEGMDLIINLRVPSV